MSLRVQSRDDTLGSGQFVQQHLMPFGDGIGPVGADDDAGDVGGDKQRRIFQRAGILQELPVRGLMAGSMVTHVTGRQANSRLGGQM